MARLRWRRRLLLVGHLGQLKILPLSRDDHHGQFAVLGRVIDAKAVLILCFHACGIGKTRGLRERMPKLRTEHTDTDSSRDVCANDAFSSTPIARRPSEHESTDMLMAAAV